MVAIGACTIHYKVVRQMFSFEDTAEHPFCHRRATNVAGADEKNVDSRALGHTRPLLRGQINEVFSTRRYQQRPMLRPTIPDCRSKTQKPLEMASTMLGPQSVGEEDEPGLA